MLKSNATSDEQDYVKLVTYPVEWSEAVAAARAADSLGVAQHPETWNWEEDIMPALKRAGFEEVDWVFGPAWD